jgi:hypothetical protein
MFRDFTQHFQVSDGTAPPIVHGHFLPQGPNVGMMEKAQNLVLIFMNMGY